MKACLVLLVAAAGCTKAPSSTGGEPTTTEHTPGYAKKPEPPVAKATVTLTSVTFADDCGGTAPAVAPAVVAPAAPAPSKRTPSAESQYAPSAQEPLARRRCEQTSMQLSVVATADTEVKVKSVEVFDEQGKSLGTLTASKATRWVDGPATYEAWDEKLAAGQAASVSYVISQPAFVNRWDSHDRTYTVKVVASVGGVDQPLQTSVMVVAQPRARTDVKRVALSLVVAIGACGEAAPPVRAAPALWSDAWILAQGPTFLGDTAGRRAALEASLANPTNMYSRIRLAAYGFGTRGWDQLPVWNPRSLAVTAEIAAALATGEPPAAPTTPLWDGVTPTTMPAWIALGQRVFFEYPMRAEVFMEYALTERPLADAVGVERTSAGDVPGLVVFANIDGETRVGITCAICHSTVKHGEVVVGQARRTFDYGKLRLTFDQVHGTIRSPDEAKRMASWGPGRADVTEDNDEDPVAIPDLWGLRDQRWLTQAGTIRHDSPLALAIRQETQLTDSNHARVRPPRELAWALAMYVYSLSPPMRTAPPSPRGAEVFAKACARCHANAAYGGNAIAATTIGTDPSLANGRGRGTGKYRVPTLLGVAEGAPYLHDGTVASLDELVSPTRTIPGHRAGTDLAPDDRAALIAFLRTL